MKKPIFTAFFLVLVSLIIGCSSPSSSDSSTGNNYNLLNLSAIQWVDSETIFDTANHTKDFSILYFTDDVCADGVLMESITFEDSAVIEALNNNYHIARISTANDSLIHFTDSLMTGNQLFMLYNLVGVPSLLILDSENRYFGRIQAGYYPADSFLVLLQYYQAK